MAKTSYYVREVVIPDTGNASCKYWAVTDTRQRIEITAGAFNTARRKGARWTQELTVPELWTVDDDRRNGDGSLSILLRIKGWLQPPDPQPARKPLLEAMDDMRREESIPADPEPNGDAEPPKPALIRAGQFPRLRRR